jgi:hypothetical protein
MHKYFFPKIGDRIRIKREDLNDQKKKTSLYHSVTVDIGGVGS